MKKLLLLVAVFALIGSVAAVTIGNMQTGERWECENHEYPQARSQSDVVAELKAQGWIDSTLVLRCNSAYMPPILAKGNKVVCMCKKLN